MRTSVFKKWVLLGLIGLCISSKSFAVRKNPHQPCVTDVGKDALTVVLSNLSLPEMRNARAVCHEFDNDMLGALQYRRSSLARGFVRIPAGYLPDGTYVPSFEAAQTPVTQEFWKEKMGYLPEGVQPNCPFCPVTHINWEEDEREGYAPAEVQHFLAKVNADEAKKNTGCTYDLSTNNQLHYMIRADVTGKSTAKYSLAIDPISGSLIEVNDAHVNEYVTHCKNSNDRIQPIGNKKLNAFGIELGNIWKMSKDIADPAHPEYGRSIRGGGWGYNVIYAESDVRRGAGAGDRLDGMGFSLVRRCGQ